MATVFEALQNARYNLVESQPTPLGLAIGRQQLRNAVVLLEKGYALDADVDILVGEHGAAENVPERAQPARHDDRQITIW